ncbi:MAG: hypothetical protein ACR2MP_12830 [Streptosporangiaceae bacterium]
MAETRTTIQEVQAELLDAVRQGQEAVFDATRHMAGAIQSIVPPIPVPSLPYAGKLPTPEELVASAYDFAEHLLATQRSFAERGLEAARPVMPGRSGTTPPGGRP